MAKRTKQTGRTVVELDPPVREALGETLWIVRPVHHLGGE